MSLPGVWPQVLDFFGTPVAIEPSPRPAVPSRLLIGFWYQAGTWPQPCWVVANGPDDPSRQPGGEGFE
jgi:hypothetical protein